MAVSPVSALRVALLAVVLVAVALQPGCALVGAVLSARGSVDELGRQVTSDAARSITGADVDALRSTSTDDIDRIIRDHPERATDPELQQVRQHLQQQPGSANRGPEDVTLEHQAEHDRRIQAPARQHKDKLVLEDLRARTALASRGTHPWLRMHQDFVGDPGASPPAMTTLGSGGQVRFE
jgi:hypothetical protein